MEILKQSPLFNIIKSTQQNKAAIKREFKKLIQYYKDNPEAFLDCLYETKQIYDSKTYLTRAELATLTKIENMINQEIEMSPENLFKFTDNFLLDNYSKIFRQIKNTLTEGELSQNAVAVVYFYSVKEEGTDKITMSEGSNFCLEKIQFHSLEFVLQYQMLFN